MEKQNKTDSEPKKTVCIECMICHKEYIGEIPEYCCISHDCGCMGMPTEPPVCSQECYNKLPINKLNIMKNAITESINSIHESMLNVTSYNAEIDVTKNIINEIIQSPIITTLLTMFWQRKSDACPLECSEMESQENDFKEWISTIDLTLIEDRPRVESILSNKNEKYCMPDGINSKEEHEQYLKDIGYKPKK